MHRHIRPTAIAQERYACAGGVKEEQQPCTHREWALMEASRGSRSKRTGNSVRIRHGTAGHFDQCRRVDAYRFLEFGLKLLGIVRPGPSRAVSVRQFHEV